MGHLSRKTAIRLGLAASLFFMVLGSRWAVVSRFGTDLPAQDQWDAEGAQILSPWLNHGLTAANFLRPHNEHRIVLTKLVNFIVTAANGQWDQRVECAVNAAIPGLIAGGLFMFFCRRLPRRWHLPIFLLLAMAYCVPLGWENTLGGLHSAQFLLIGLSAGAIAWLAESKPGSPGWWLGAGCAVLAMGSLATGFFAAAVVIGLLAVRLRRREVLPQAAAPALAFCAFLVAAGYLTRVKVDDHGLLAAHGMSDFAPAMLHSLEWPSAETSWLAVILWLPWAWLVCRVLAGAGGRARTFGYTLAGLGGWVILQIIATAYARGAAGSYPASRYIDTLLFGSVVNGIAMAWLWEEGALGRRRRVFLPLLAAGWLLAFGWGLAQQTRWDLESALPAVKSFNQYCEQNTRNYLATGDPSYLERNEIPYPGADSYRVRLELPGLRSLLPASVRPPIRLEAAAGGSPFMRRGGISPGTPPLTHRATWGSYAGGGAGSTGQWESAPVPAPHRGWLRFEVAGQLGGPGTVLELRDAGTGALLDEVSPGQIPGNAWRAVHVRAPGRSFVVEARNSDPRHWLAFSDPVEMGPISYWVAWAVKFGLMIAAAAGAAALLLAFQAARYPEEVTVLKPDITHSRGGPWATWDWSRRTLAKAEHIPFLRPVLLVLATAVIWLVLIELPVPMGAVGLDASWEEVLVQAHLRGWQLGQDIIFTYGPWGYLISACVPHGALVGKYAWEIGGKIAIAAAIVAMSGAIPGRRRWIFLIAAPLFLALLADTSILLLIALVVLVWLVRVETPPWLAALGVLALAFLAEMKFTNCLLGAVGAAAAAGSAAGSGRKLRAAAFAAGFPLAFVAFWIAGGQNPGHLYDFFRYSLSVTGGYGSCMGADETWPVFLAGAGAMLLNLAFAVRLWRTGRISPAQRMSALFFAAVSFLAWKQGFVRADDHVYIFFCFSLLMALALPDLFLPGRRGTWLYANVPVCLLGMWLADPGPVAQLGAIVCQRVGSGCASLVHPGTIRENYDAQALNEAALNQLPVTRAAVGRGSIDMINFEQGLLLHNYLDYRPRPVFQSYCAFTPQLMEKNLDFYLSPRAPDFVLLRLGSVDSHYPMEDDGVVLAELPLRYGAMPDETEGVLLRREDSAAAAPGFTRQPVSSADANVGEDIPLPPERDHALWMRAFFPLSVPGKVRAALYKPPLVFMVVTEEGGAQVRYRIAPPMADEGFVIQPTIETTADYAAFAAGQGLKWARAIRFEAGEGEAKFLGRIRVEFFRIPELPMKGSGRQL